MQLRKPVQNQGSAPHSSGSLLGKSHGSWFTEWLENKGKYVLLACGHKADLNDKGQTNLIGAKRGDMLTICVKCWQFSRVTKHITFNEYRDIPTAVIPDEPLF